MEFAGQRFRLIGGAFHFSLGRLGAFAEKNALQKKPAAGEGGSDADGQGAIAGKEALQFALRADGDHGGRMIDRGQRGADFFSSRDDLQRDGSLANRRQELRGQRGNVETETFQFERPRREVEIEALQPGLCKDDGIHVRSRAEFAQARGDIAAPLDDFQIRPGLNSR